jgi:HK97 gp10 family phage protein
MAIVIQGMDSLIIKLNSMGGNVKNALLRGVQSTITTAQADAKRMSPVDTGALKMSISATSKGTTDGAEGKVYTNNPYAIYQEMGTIKMAAQPYMMPSLNANKATFEYQIEKELRTEIQKMGG